MTKKKLVILIIIAVVVIAIVSFVIVFMLETQHMVQVPSGELEPGVIIVKDEMVNFFLIASGDGYIAIDTGNGHEVGLNELRKMNINPDKVKAVFLTHSDQDHTGGLDFFSKAVVYLPEKEEQMIDGTTSRFFTIKNQLQGDYTLIKDGETVELAGVFVKAFLTPGHTAGSTSYLVNGKYLFSGDCLSLKKGMVALFIYMNKRQTVDTLDRMKNNPELSGADYLITAHYGYTQKVKEAFDGWRR